MKNRKTSNEVGCAEMREVRRPAGCPLCGEKFTGDGIVITIIGNHTKYLHPKCAKENLSGAALMPFNDNGGSRHYFDTKIHITASNAAELYGWVYYFRYCGFDTRVGVNRIVATGDAPAQSISKILQSVYNFSGTKSVDIDKKKFKTYAEAYDYINSVTDGNSH